MAEDASFVPLEEKRVDFYGDEIVAYVVRDPDAVQVYVPLRSLCQFMAISWPSQLNRIYRDDVLKTSVFMMNTQLPGDTQRREHGCLPLDVLPGWLFGIRTARVKPELQEKVKRYRRECFRVLWEAFKPHILREETALAPADGAPAISASQRIAEMGRAMMQLAEQQIALQRQQHVLAQRLDKAGRVVRGMQIDIADIQVRRGSVENKLHPHASITDEQAAHVSQLVKALANLLTERGGKNQDQGIFAELDRRFGVSGYKLIRIAQYNAVLAFLEQWREAAMRGAE